MRILVDIRHLTRPNPSGVGQYTIELLEALLRIDQENEYVLFSTGRRPLPPLPSSLIPLLFHLPIPNKLFNLRSLLLKHPPMNWHVRQAIDLIFLPNLNITVLPSDIPSVLTIHDLSWKLYPEFYSKKMQLWHRAVRPEYLIAQSRRMIVPSACTAQDLEREYGVTPDRVSVIPHGVAAEMSPTMQARDHGVRSRLKLPKRFVLFVGTIEPRKNLLALIEGVKDYRDRSHDDLHLVIAGAWGWRSHDVRRRLWKHDTQGWVHALGYVPQEDRPALYRSTLALACPSIYEGFGLPPLEAMACGTPVIASHTSSLPEVTGEAAMYIDPYNSADIAEALRGLMGSSSLAASLRDRGIERAKHFSWDNAARETIAVFRNVSRS